MANVAFIGLGVMGYPMAGHLATAGHSVTVYNRSAKKAETWVNQYGGKLALSPATAAKSADFVFACVGDDDDLRAVTSKKDGAFEGMARGSIFVDHTTASANVARELTEVALHRGLHFLDAPVSGGQAGAEKGALTIMVGGDATIYAKTEPVLQSYGKLIQHLGPSGSGQLTKMVNQICIVGTIQALSEGLNFAKIAGLDVKKVLASITKGAAGSWQMEHRGQTMADGKFDFGFAVDLMRKDIGICLKEAKSNGASLPVTAMIDQFYSDLQAMGHSRSDTSSLILRLSQLAKPAKKPNS
jgi:3-hydroxyisobutyrate dehydrogenase-like beta-hydroxyacid dehydrogenase